MREENKIKKVVQGVISIENNLDKILCNLLKIQEYAKRRELV